LDLVQNDPLPIPGLSLEVYYRKLAKSYLLNAPYQSYSYLIKFLREALIVPLAKFSNHQFNQSGKKVIVQIELQVFDEASNISCRTN
jgi:polyphosphate kinase